MCLWSQQALNRQNLLAFNVYGCGCASVYPLGLQRSRSTSLAAASAPRAALLESLLRGAHICSVQVFSYILPTESQKFSHVPSHCSISVPLCLSWQCFHIYNILKNLVAFPYISRWVTLLDMIISHGSFLSHLYVWFPLRFYSTAFYSKQQANRLHLLPFAWKLSQLNIQFHHLQVLISLYS